VNAQGAHEHGPADLGTTGPHRGIDLPAAVTIAWSLAGGMLLGGAAVVLMLVTGRLDPHRMLTTSGALFGAGAMLGVAHGVVLGIFGRPEGTGARQAVGAILHGLLYLVPSLLLGGLVAGWVAAMPMALGGGHVIATGISALAWLAMLVTTGFAALNGLRAARLAYRRWPQRAAGTALVAATLAALVVAFLIRPPAPWPTYARVGTPGAVGLAVVATFWFYGPLVTLALWLGDRSRPAPGAAGRSPSSPLRRALLGTGIAVLTGLVLAAVALPLYRGAVHLPSDVARLGFAGAMLMALSSAFTNELFFRLVVVTVAFVLASRVVPRAGLAAALAIALGTVLDLLVHLRDVPALGLPGTGAAMAYVAARLVIPSIVFGILFWRRGLATAVGAHLATGVALGLLAL